MIKKIYLISAIFAAHAYAQGNDPIVINTAQDLQNINQNLSATYVLAKDLDLSNVSFTPIGSSKQAFVGSLEGNHHSINHLTLNLANQDNIGLFANIGSTGSVSDLGVTNAAINGHNNVAIVAGSNGGMISNVYVSGKVIGAMNVGGVVGSNLNGTLQYCQAAANIVPSNDFAGILVGGNSGSIKNSAAEGTVDAPHSNHIGGLVGDNGEEGSIINSYALGSISGEDNVGGLTGGNYTGELLNDFADVAVNATGVFVGGLSGDNVGSRAKITNTYALGKVSDSQDNVGGLIGYNEGKVTSSYWDIDTTGQTQSDGGEGESDSAMQTQATYQTWDFINVWIMQKYPLLRNVP